MTWAKFEELLTRYPLPAARLVHHLTCSEAVL